MKKCVVCLLLLPLWLFGGCKMKAVPCNAAELRQYNWNASLDGGGSVSLRFDGDRAELMLRNAGEEERIAGKMLADEESFVIFDSRLSQNYAFSYQPHGKKLDLTFEGNTIELHAEAEK